MIRSRTAILLCSILLLFSLSSCSFVKPGTVNPSGNQDAQPTSLYDADGKISYTKVFTESSSATLPLMKTDIDGLFYTMDTQGNVRFFRLIDGILTEQAATGVYSASVKCSGQSIPVDIHYITVDGVTNGYGLYTFSSEYNIMLYDYAFFKLCELPDGFEYGNELLLLIDTDKSRFYSDKIYSEQFYFDPATSQTAGYFLSEAQRQTGMDGVNMKDYKMFTDAIVSQPQDEIYFFTSRSYVADDVKKVDIYTSGGYDTNVDNIPVVWDVMGMFFHRTADGVYYYNKLANGFCVNFYDYNKDTNIKEFEGNFETDYLRSGTAILQIANGSFYDIAANASFTFDYSVFGSGFLPTDFIHTDKYAAIVGESPSGGLQIGVYDKADNKVIIFDDFTNRNMEKVHITDDGFLVVSVCYESDYTAFTLLCDLNKF